MAEKSGGESRFAPKTFAPAPAPAPTRPISIERSVDEGVLIASAAVTMDVKNYIIVEAIRDGSTFDAANVEAAVRRELLELANENEASAHRVQQLSVDVQTARGPRDRDNSEGYEFDDHPTLTKRGVIHVMLAAELERLSEDPKFVADLAERARVRAWADVGSAIETRLIDSIPRPRDPDYEAEKDARIRALLDINFRALEKQSKRRSHRRPK
jgi:hypothetical protein